MSAKSFVKIIAAISIIANVALVFLLFQSPTFSNSIDNIEQSIEPSVGNIEPSSSFLQNTDDDKTSDLSIEDEREFQIYIMNEPLFYGNWKVVEVIPADFTQPSYISGFYEDGTFRGPDTSTILGEAIAFSLDYAEYLGEKHEYVCRPRTYSHSLSEDTQIIYNYATTLGIFGSYYSVVHFLLPNHDRIIDEPKEVKISDIRSLYLKDRNTIYADAYYGITYRLERVE